MSVEYLPRYDDPPLLPCPFCGGKACYYGPDYDTVYCVTCEDCGAEGGWGKLEDKQSSAELWNKRTKSAAAVSELGKDFMGRSLNEDTLDGGQMVLYQNREFVTGNRYKNQVELFLCGKKQEFVRTVDASAIRLLDLSRPAGKE
jgi:Lar family restriction alleviation protein